MSHKSGHIIIQMAAIDEDDPIKSAEVEIDVTGKTAEEAAAMTKRVVRKIEAMSKDDED